MKHKGKKPLNVALYGMDDRSCKTMSMFLSGPCQGVAVVVEAANADIDIIDADFSTAKDILDERQITTPDRPIILMSLEEIRLGKTIYLKKPVSKEGLCEALEQGRVLLKDRDHKPVDDIQSAEVETKQEKTNQKIAEETAQIAIPENIQKKPLDKDEQKKTSKHKTARQYTEGSFSAFIGILSEVDFDTREQFLKASYNPKNYFQGYAGSAIKVARDKGGIMQFDMGWKPLIIFPQGHEVWLDADEQQLSAFAGIRINKSSGSKMTLTDVELDSNQAKYSFDKFNNIDVFMWKVAVLTSKGRFPSAIDIERPVYLRRWPDLTRMLVTPHALRIAALLIRQPRPTLSIADALKIKPEYVFVFISACYALGLLGQAVRQSDQLLAPTEIKATKSKNLFKKILGKLRGSK